MATAKKKVLNLITEKTIAARLDVSIGTVRNLRARDPSFPQPIKITNDTIRYDAHTLETWVKSRPLANGSAAK